MCSGEVFLVNACVHVVGEKINKRGEYQMQCDDCREVYRAENEKQSCPRCGGKGTVLVDITRGYYPNRAARRAAHNERIEKYLPCPECQGEKVLV